MRIPTTLIDMAPFWGFLFCLTKSLSLCPVSIVRLSDPLAMGCTASYRLVNVKITVANLDVIPAFRICTNPCLIVDRSPLTTEI